MPRSLSVTVPTDTLLQMIQEAVDERFGREYHGFHPFCPHCVAQTGVLMLREAFADDDSELLDTLAQKLIDDSDSGSQPVPAKPKPTKH